MPGAIGPDVAASAVLVEIVELAEHGGGSEAGQGEVAADLVELEHGAALRQLAFQLPLALERGRAERGLLGEQVEVVAGRLRGGLFFGLPLHQRQERRDLPGRRRGQCGEQEDDHRTSRTTGGADRHDFVRDSVCGTVAATSSVPQDRGCACSAGPWPGVRLPPGAPARLTFSSGGPAIFAGWAAPALASARAASARPA